MSTPTSNLHSPDPHSDESKRIKYGFSFAKYNAGGMGAMIHAMVLAYHYAKFNNHDFVLVEEGRRIPRFNGASTNADGQDKEWHDYFTPLTYAPESQIKGGVWTSTPNGWNTNLPPGQEDKYSLRIEWYAQLCREIYQIKPEIMEELNRRIDRTGFNAETDLALHIRRTDKLFKMDDYEENGAKVTAGAADKRESGVVTLSYYVEQTMKVWEESGASRIYLCTDDKQIRDEMLKRFAQHNIPVLWDETESERAIQHLRMNNKLTREEAWEDNLVALTNMEILVRARYIVGGRMSYFFRIPELVRYPKPSLNIKDSDSFGKATYAESSEKVVFPLPISSPNQKEGHPDEDEVDVELNPDTRYDSDGDDSSAEETQARSSPNTRTMLIPSPAIDERFSVPFDEMIDQLEQKRIITLPNFLTPATAAIIRQKIPHYKRSWWNHAFTPIQTEDGLKWKSAHHATDLPICQERYQVAKSRFDRGEFAYSYHRSEDHYSTCTCFACYMEHLFKTDEVKTALENLIGHPIVQFNEMFTSMYTEGDFLSMHHDKDKGDYTFILNLTDDWSPAHGGLTHFWDSKQKKVYLTSVPEFGSLTIFKLDKSVQMDHFVSMVVAPKNRYAFTGWVNVKKSSAPQLAKKRATKKTVAQRKRAVKRRRGKGRR